MRERDGIYLGLPMAISFLPTLALQADSDWQPW